MKIISLISFVAISSFAFAQKGDNLFVSDSTSKNNKNLYIENVKRFYSGNEKKKPIEIHINKNVLERDSFSVTIDQKKYNAFKDNKAKYTKKGQNWIGYLKDTIGNISIAFDGNDFDGHITIGNKSYLIKSIGNGQNVIFEIDQTQFPSEKCFFNDSTIKNYNPIGITPKLTDGVLLEKSNNLNSSSATSSSVSTNCNLRILVAYTNAAASHINNIKNHAQLAIDATNIAYSNSQINNQIELAGVVLVNYTETDFETDLNRFALNKDNYMDEIHSLKDLYSADVCVLMVENNDYCGLAKDILATPSNSFCLVNYDCAISNYSIAHEVGHLLGARHDTYVDNSNSPFSYGHGYVNLAGHWRTIMAYKNQCTANGFDCTRIQYFSNPNVLYNGVSTGNTLTCDVARTLNATIPIVKNYEIPEFNVNLQNTTILNNNSADIIAINNITTSPNYIIQNGGDAYFKAGNEVILNSEFKVELGGTLNIKQETIPDCCIGNIIPLIDNGSLIILSSCQLCLSFNCATSFNATIKTLTGSVIGNTSGSIINNNACIWQASNLAIGYYYVTITLYNSTQSLKVDYVVYLTQRC